MDTFGLSDPFVEVRLNQGDLKKIIKTDVKLFIYYIKNIQKILNKQIKKDTTDPVWNTKGEFF